MWYEQPEKQVGYEIDSEGYIKSQVVFRGAVPESVITEEVPADIENPRWDFESEQWVDGEREYEPKKDAVDALAEELLDFKIAYNSVPCQHHKDYPAFIDELMRGGEQDE